MEDEGRTKSELIRELKSLRRQVKRSTIAEHKRKQTEEVLRESEERYRLLVELSPDSVVLHSKGKIIFVNPATLKMLGATRKDEVIGKPVLDFVHPDCRQEIVERIQQQAQGKIVPSLQEKFLRLDGSIIDVETTAAPIRYHGESISLVIFRDITGRKRVEEALATEHNLLHTVIDSLPDRIYVKDTKSRFLLNNFAHLRSLGAKSQEEVRGKTDFDFRPPEFATRYWADDQNVIKSGEALINREEPTVFSSRNKGWHLATKVPLRDPQKKIIGLVGISRDITERKLAEEALKESVSLLQATLESTADGILVVDKSGKITSHNRRFVKMWRIPDNIIESKNDDLVINHVLEQLKDPEAFLSKVRELYAHPAERSFDVLEFKDGRIFERYSRAQKIDGNPVGRVWSFRDVTLHKKAEQEIRLLAQTLASTQDCVSITDLEDRIIFLNDAFLQTYGYTREELLGQPISIVRTTNTSLKIGNQILKATSEGRWSGELFNRRKDGSEFPVELWTSVVKDESGKVIAMVGVARDITERRHAEEALRESEERFRTTLYSIGDGVITTDTNGNIQQMNHVAEQLTGWDETEAYGKKIDEIFKIFNEQTNAPALNPVASVLKKGIVVGLANHTVLIARDGTQRPIADSGAPIRNSRGEVTGVVLVFNDQSERRGLQDQLFQAQKMEAIGQLAGGVAHDFNNMINVILGYASMMEEDFPPADPSYHKIKAIISTAERSANLTKQLLAFARKQIIAPVPKNLNQELIPLQKMLGRLIGEDIALNISYTKDLWDIKIDPVQLTQVLTNLAANARDAIENTGSVSIETANVRIEEALGHGSKKIPAGEYVQLIFSDTGKGMNKEILGRIFEPFFTTKPKGVGTGLGLSTVFGIVKQNNGFINVYSEPDQGTTFKIYFPRHQGTAETPDELQQEIPLNGTETVLIVEDEGEILTLAKLVLEKYGYKVLHAQSPSDALASCEHYREKIDLLITDVIMPGMNGKELKERLDAKYPGIKVLFMSGYPADIVAHRGVLEEGVEFLQKPFTPVMLAKKIREVLNG
jgi:PAS domain S-box-containing protein